MDQNIIKALETRLLEIKSKLSEIQSKFIEGSLPYDPTNEIRRYKKESDTIRDFLITYAKGNVNVHGKKCTPKKCVCGIGFN